MCVFLLNLSSVEAANNNCSTSVKKDLARAAALVKMNYEIKDFSEEKTLEVDGKETTYKVPNYVFEISIYNVAENLNVYVRTTNGEKELTVTNDQTTDDIYTFTDDNFGEIYNYEFTVRSNDQKCSGVTLRTAKFTKPRYNPYSEFTYCKNSSNYYCQRFIGTEINIKDENDFLEKISTNNEKNDPNKNKTEEKKEVKELIQKYWKVYLTIFIIVLITTVVVIVYITNHRKKKGWRL